MEKDDRMYIPEKYMVLIAAVRLLSWSKTDTLEVRNIIDLSVFKEEPLGYSSFYCGLIESIIKDKAQEFFDDLVSNSTYQNEEMIKNFKALQKCKNDKFLLLLTLEMQLIELAHRECGGLYDFHFQRVHNFLYKTMIFKRLLVYKKNKIVLNNHLLYLNIRLSAQAEGKDIIESLSFHL